MFRRTRLLLFVLLFSVAVSVPSIQAVWLESGNPICTESSNQQLVKAATSGSGAIFTWRDHRGFDIDIYAQRIDIKGDIQWTGNGVPICTSTGSDIAINIIPDGYDGAYIVWHSNRSSDYDIYVQRVNSSGTVHWVTDGVAVCTFSGDQNAPQIIADGTGGVIIAWEDYRNGSTPDIYAQKVSGSGVPQWIVNGRPVCVAAEYQTRPQLICDGAGGAIITWEDSRSGTNFNIYAQRVNASGTAQWVGGGVELAPYLLYDQQSPDIISDGEGGAIIAWEDGRDDFFNDIYAQRINSAGVLQWASTGVPICELLQNQEDVKIVSDGAGGAIMTWYGYHGGGNGPNIFAQRVDASGAIQWPATGVGICVAIGTQNRPEITADGSGGAVITWDDNRNGVGQDVYTQQVNSSGAVGWVVDGIPVSTIPTTQYYPCIASDGLGGAFIAWKDVRAGAMNGDIYSQWVHHGGKTGYFGPDIHSILDVPGDEGGLVYLAWDASVLDLEYGEITEYTIWRALSTEAAQVMVENGAKIASTPFEALKSEPASAGVEGDVELPVLRLAPMGEQYYYWEHVSSVTAVGLPGYGKPIETLFDSTVVCDDYHYFQVIALTATPGEYYTSDPDSGYSVDNLSPCPPVALVGEQLYQPEGLQLTWDPNTEPDLGCYKIYRGTSETFQPGRSAFLASTCDPAYFDGTWDWGAGFWYKISAVDVNFNESDYAVFGPQEITDDETPQVKSFLAQNYPNPFNPSTTIVFGLKDRRHVSLKIYDAAGKLVTSLIDELRPAGRYSVVWNGKDKSGSLTTSGVYFYRLVAGDFAQTRKMVLLR